MPPRGAAVSVRRKRKPSEFHSEVTRERIRAGVIIDRFQKHFMGELDLTPTQIRVGEVLLRKVIPDLTHTDLNTTAERWDLRRGFWPHSSISPQFEAKEVMRLHWISATTL